jgi:acetyl-CoA carboxylase alpha subunit
VSLLNTGIRESSKLSRAAEEFDLPLIAKSAMNGAQLDLSAEGQWM